MKRLYLLAILLLAGMCAPLYAQYFQHEYWPGDVRATDGINAKIHAPGHVLCGLNHAAGSITNRISVTYTDEHGTPHFNKVYSIGTGAISVATAPKICEIPNGFGIMGICSDGIYYFTIDLMGNPGPISVYWFTAATNVYSLSGPDLKITKSASGNEIYFTSSFFDNSFNAHIFAGKIDINGALLWGHAYDMTSSGFPFSVPIDLLESPYMPAGPPELTIVGGIFGNPPTPILGLFFRVNANDGTPIGLPVFYGTSNTMTSIHSITVSNSTASGGNGFILSGSSDFNTGGLLIAKITPTGGLLWSNSYDDPVHIGKLGGTSGVIERQNTLGAYEYYALGTLEKGANWSDAVVIKVDDLGNPAPLGEFIYTDNTYSLRPVSIDQFNGTGFDGISIFCNKEDNNFTWYGHHIKAYFNGKLDCNESFRDPNVSAGPETYGESQISNFGGMVPLSTSAAFISNSTDNQICYTLTVIDGDNTGPAQDEGSTGLLSPNPINASWLHAALSIEAKGTSVVQVGIYDMLGREYFSRQFEVTKGQNTLDLDLSTTGMAPGIYTVKITAESGSSSLNLVVK